MVNNTDQTVLIINNNSLQWLVMGAINLSKPTIPWNCFVFDSHEFVSFAARLALPSMNFLELLALFSLC
jgi:hypothetical protein